MHFLYLEKIIIESKITNAKFLQYVSNKSGNLELYAILLNCHISLDTKDILANHQAQYLLPLQTFR